MIYTISSRQAER